MGSTGWLPVDMFYGRSLGKSNNSPNCICLTHAAGSSWKAFPYGSRCVALVDRFAANVGILPSFTRRTSLSSRTTGMLLAALLPLAQDVEFDIALTAAQAAFDVISAAACSTQREAIDCICANCASERSCCDSIGKVSTSVGGVCGYSVVDTCKFSLAVARCCKRATNAF